MKWEVRLKSRIDGTRGLKSQIGDTRGFRGQLADSDCFVDFVPLAVFDFQAVCGDLSGISELTASRITKRVTEALAGHVNVGVFFLLLFVCLLLFLICLFVCFVFMLFLLSRKKSHSRIRTA